MRRELEFLYDHITLKIDKELTQNRDKISSKDLKNMETDMKKFKERVNFYLDTKIEKADFTIVNKKKTDKRSYLDATSKDIPANDKSQVNNKKPENSSFSKTQRQERLADGCKNKYGFEYKETDYSFFVDKDKDFYYMKFPGYTTRYKLNKCLYEDKCTKKNMCTFVHKDDNFFENCAQ